MYQEQTSQQALNVPTRYWESLSPEDKAEYLLLRNSFRNHITTTSKDRQTTTILNDLRTVLNYVERRPECKEARGVVTGLICSGYYVCVNTRQLKVTISRCKSSINNGFHQLGYTSAKQKVRHLLLNVLPSLLNDSALMRQWTVRCGERDSISLSQKPSISQTSMMIRAPRQNALPTPMINQNQNHHPFIGSFPERFSNESPDVSPPINRYVMPLTIPRPYSTPNNDIPSFSIPVSLSVDYYEPTSFENRIVDEMSDASTIDARADDDMWMNFDAVT